MTIKAVLQSTRTALAEISDAPALDAERLLLQVQNLPEASWLYTHSDAQVSASNQKKLASLVARRADGEPLAYLLGYQEFYGRRFLVTRDVLIPRPDTETLVETALAYIQTMVPHQPLGKPFVIADIGTGSGCIAITLAKELEKNYHLEPRTYNLIATDISDAALRVARQNAKRHDVADKIEFLQGDMLAPLAGRQIDLIASNPPYLPAEKLRQLAEAKAGRASSTRGRDFEPRLALDGGPDGQRYVRQLMNAEAPAIFETTGGVIRLNDAFKVSQARHSVITN